MAMDLVKIAFSWTRWKQIEEIWKHEKNWIHYINYDLVSSKKENVCMRSSLLFTNEHECINIWHSEAEVRKLTFINIWNVLDWRFD